MRSWSSFVEAQEGSGDASGPLRRPGRLRQGRDAVSPDNSVVAPGLVRDRPEELVLGGQGLVPHEERLVDGAGPVGEEAMGGQGRDESLHRPRRGDASCGLGLSRAARPRMRGPGCRIPDGTEASGAGLRLAAARSSLSNPGGRVLMRSSFHSGGMLKSSTSPAGSPPRMPLPGSPSAARTCRSRGWPPLLRGSCPCR